MNPEVSKASLFGGIISTYRWRQQYGGLKISQVKYMKDVERKNIAFSNLLM